MKSVLLLSPAKMKKRRLRNGESSPKLYSWSVVEKECKPRLWNWHFQLPSSSTFSIQAQHRGYLPSFTGSKLIPKSALQGLVQMKILMKDL